MNVQIHVLFDKFMFYLINACWPEGFNNAGETR